MKHIIKSDSPPEFENWKNKYHLTETDLLQNPPLDGKIWDKFRGKIKNKVKESLLGEQGFICCYCQQYIELNEQTSIEHFIARNTDLTKTFDYTNIFASCDGGKSERGEQKKDNILKIERRPLTCDPKKDKEKLFVNPLEELCESHFYYEFNPESLEVSITGISEEGKDAVNKLNLNVDELRILRGEAVTGIIFDENGDYISYEEAELLALKIKQRQENNKFQPFCVVLESVLKNL